MNRKPSLSFCITCKNRFHQISSTLRQNLDDNRQQQKHIEFVLVDFGSIDGLKEWILPNFREELDSGYLRYFYTDELPYWHASIAKNTAHLLARNDILVNLDCDNYTGYHGGKFVIDRFVNNRMDIVLHQFGGDLYDGSFGRISVLKKFFYRIGGYDESFEPMGYQDKDLFERLKAAGLLYIPVSDHRYNKAIPNSKEEGLVNTGSTKKFLEMLRANRNKSEQNIEKKRLISNNGVFGIRENLYEHDGKHCKTNQKNYSMIKFPSLPEKFQCLDGTVPKIIHQIWEGRTGSFPDTYVYLAETWKQHYPQWHYILWDGKRMDVFIETHYPQYLDMYRSFPYHEQRWDAIRYLILNKVGGMYIDFDYESIEPMDELLKGKTCCFAMEPESHCQQLDKPIVFNNALMICAPGHLFMQKIVQTVFFKEFQKSVNDAQINHANEIKRKKQIVFHSTGHCILLELYNQLPENEKNDVYLIPSKYVTPFDFKQAYFAVRGANTEKLNQCLSEAYAVYYFLERWKNDDELKNNVIKDFLFLQPIHLTNKIRIGNQRDGGYVVYQPALDKTDVLVTYGVGWDVSFEVNFHELTGKKVWMYDPTLFDVDISKSERYIDRVNQWKQKLKKLQELDIIFRDEGISTIKKPKYNTFENHLKDNHIDSKKILLKMDIEGDEYAIFENYCFHENLQLVNQIIVEFHDLKNQLRRLKNICILLKNDFEIIHIHGNNSGVTFMLYGAYKDICFPDVVEITWIRKDCIRKEDILTEPVSYPVAGLDYPNRPGHKDYVLTFN